MLGHIAFFENMTLVYASSQTQISEELTFTAFRAITLRHQIRDSTVFVLTKFVTNTDGRISDNASSRTFHFLRFVNKVVGDVEVRLDLFLINLCSRWSRPPADPGRDLR